MDILTFIERHPIWSMIALIVIASAISNVFRRHVTVINTTNKTGRDDE